MEIFLVLERGSHGTGLHHFHSSGSHGNIHTKIQRRSHGHAGHPRGLQWVPAAMGAPGRVSSSGSPADGLFIRRQVVSEDKNEEAISS
uniref:Uncharacterized protein n=1 Tax=Picea sitchensis TaxID=3332 RepID=A9P0T6_PICSI|nr:unknown [Picea sitchensis]